MAASNTTAYKVYSYHADSVRVVFLTINPDGSDIWNTFESDPLPNVRSYFSNGSTLNFRKCGDSPKLPVQAVCNGAVHVMYPALHFTDHHKLQLKLYNDSDDSGFWTGNLKIDPLQITHLQWIDYGSILVDPTRTIKLQQEEFQLTHEDKEKWIVRKGSNRDSNGTPLTEREDIEHENIKLVFCCDKNPMIVWSSMTSGYSGWNQSYIVFRLGTYNMHTQQRTTWNAQFENMRCSEYKHVASEDGKLAFAVCINISGSSPIFVHDIMSGTTLMSTHKVNCSETASLFITGGGGCTNQQKLLCAGYLKVHAKKVTLPVALKGMITEWSGTRYLHVIDDVEAQHERVPIVDLLKGII